MVLRDGESESKPALNESLMERIVSSTNMQRAWKQVKSNRGSPGVDGRTVEEFPKYVQNRWERTKRALLEGYYVPSPVLRVEIPKKSGGKRMLGIPTVLDRVIQQAISQVLSPLFDPEFSEYSYGFRPGRSAHEAVKQVQEYIREGYNYAVEVDLEKFFDTVNHDLLMHFVGRKVRDKRVLRLIGRYLRAGVKDQENHYMPTRVGTPQGGPLSPLLSNILLDQVDKELESREQRFARYADDVRILVKDVESGERILAELAEFLNTRLKLKVNREKSKVERGTDCVFLGFTFKGKKIRWSQEAYNGFRHELKSLTRRSWGVSMEYRLNRLNKYVRGWMNYYGISQYYRGVQDIDSWVRRRIRMCYWKSWRKTGTNVKNLKKLGIPERFAVMAGASGKSYWHLSKKLCNQCWNVQ